MSKTLTLAHYYTVPEVQKLADHVGDSLDLALYAKKNKADVIIFAGVKFMAETVKIINPSAKVILPDYNSTCSLVTMTNIEKLKQWRQKYSEYTHVAYINSSVEHKTIADWIVTSRNVVEIIQHLYSIGEKVIYSPDRNMGAYLNYEYGFEMKLWDAVCEVHDKFNSQQLDLLFNSITSDKYLIAHPESPLPVLKKSNYIGSTHGLLNWIINFSGKSNSVIFVATEEGILYNMKDKRPDLDIRQAPIYSGCKCNSCPYMKMNTIDLVKKAQIEHTGFEINYLTDDIIQKAITPIERMLNFNEK